MPNTNLEHKDPTEPPDWHTALRAALPKLSEKEIQERASLLGEMWQYADTWMIAPLRQVTQEIELGMNFLLLGVELVRRGLIYFDQPLRDLYREIANEDYLSREEEMGRIETAMREWWPLGPADENKISSALFNIRRALPKLQYEVELLEVLESDSVDSKRQQMRSLLDGVLEEASILRKSLDIS